MNRRLLIVEDDRALLDLYTAILNPPPPTSGNTALALDRAPFDLVVSTNGEDAIAQIKQSLKQGSPLVGGFFGLNGNGIGGIETIRRAKELDPDLLCVIVTGQLDRSVDEIHKIFGRDYADQWDFLNKPFSRAEILQKAQNLISNWDRRKREKEYIEKIESQQDLLLRSERLAALGALAKGLGPEFGDILQGIMGKVDVALDSDSKEKMTEALKSILPMAETAGMLARNLQSLVKKEGDREPLSLAIPLKEAFQLLEFEMKRFKVRLVTEGLDALPVMKLNHVELNQTFLNIVLNAIQAMDKKGGELRVHAAMKADGWVDIEFCDEGSGISADNLGKIFEPLFTTKTGKGPGIGLSVVRRTLESYGGRISVRSEVGRGSTFTVSLPTNKKD